jgi:hypothetical protein
VFKDPREFAGHFGVEEDVTKFKTEELPNFGVVFRNNPGTAKETYLAFKSGPARGHYHGDQLSFHYAVNAMRIAVDHHCSYGPRAGQEHMHNRVAFGTDDIPFANMDGYERVIAFKTSDKIDVAVGQVESWRIRKVTDLPPEPWHMEYPQVQFKDPLVYRRTIVMVKGGPADYFVIRDQFSADRELNATFCLHVYGNDAEQKERVVDFGTLKLFVAKPEKFALAKHNWTNPNGGPEKTAGGRVTLKARSGEFITVMYPGEKLPDVSALPNGVKVGADIVTFDGAIDDVDATAYVAAKAGGGELTLTGKDIDLDRFQGEIGLFVPDAGYPFGEIPDWLARQRSKIPDWAPDWAKKIRSRPQ